ncbi:MAG: HAMP domain-containing sensor histidine kinase [Tissierellia bacterium]|nr:HAMP domain-containing sensor histidine kinase [Tissierellia bacterium]
MKRSIKNRLVNSFMLIIFVIMISIGIVFLNGVRIYHYSAAEDQLSKNLELSIDNFNLFYSNYTLNEIVINDYNKIWSNSKTQSQIIDTDSYLLLDTIGYINDEQIHTADVKKAIDGEKGVWIGYSDYTKDKLMAVSMPIINNNGTIIGVLRYISSLEETDFVIKKTSLIFIVFAIIIIIIAMLMSLILSNSIVKPLIGLNKVARKMAQGQYKIRSNLDMDDEIGDLSNTLNYMAEEILKREQIKNDFISSISHELRTPLTSIKGWAATLKAVGNKDEAMFDDGIDIIERESDRLSKMVEELLDFSRYISGRIQLEKDVFSIRETIAQIAMQMRPHAKNKNHELILDMTEDFEFIIGDENRIKQVLINLLDNAIKFTNEGKIYIIAYREDSNLIIKIKDTGIGISAQDLPRIKEKFYKGKHSESHSGLGLSIAEEIVKLHEGTMEIESTEGEGTIVSLTLPLPDEEDLTDETN